MSRASSPHRPGAPARRGRQERLRRRSACPSIIRGWSPRSHRSRCGACAFARPGCTPGLYKRFLAFVFPRGGPRAQFRRWLPSKALCGWRGVAHPGSPIRNQDYPLSCRRRTWRARPFAQRGCAPWSIWFRRRLPTPISSPHNAPRSQDTRARPAPRVILGRGSALGLVRNRQATRRSRADLAKAGFQTVHRAERSAPSRSLPEAELLFRETWNTGRLEHASSRAPWEKPLAGHVALVTWRTRTIGHRHPSRAFKTRPGQKSAVSRRFALEARSRSRRQKARRLFRPSLATGAVRGCGCARCAFEHTSLASLSAAVATSSSRQLPAPRGRPHRRGRPQPWRDSFDAQTSCAHQ